MIGTIIVWVVIGGLAGWVASMLFDKATGADTNRRMGVGENIVAGILGGFLGGFVLRAVTDEAKFNDISVASFLTALVGAVAVIAVWRALKYPGRKA